MDINDLNNQLADLTKDWERHNESTNMYSNPEVQKRNDKINQMRQYIPPSATPQIAHPSMHNYPTTFTQTEPAQPTRIPQYQPSQQQQPQQYQSHQQQPQQYQNITAGHYQSQPQMSRTEAKSSDPRATMNERLGNFRFDHAGSTYGMPGLVPVNLDHVYSGNLFSEGLPVPQDLRDQFTLTAAGTGQSSRMLHQEKSKTMYRSDVNERLAELSPLGRALYYPVNGQQHPQQQLANKHPPPQQNWMANDPSQQQQHFQNLQQEHPSQFQIQNQALPQNWQGHETGLSRPQQQMPAYQPAVSTRRADLKADISNRLSQHPSLAAASAPESQYINMGYEPFSPNNHQSAQITQPKKVMYQDMYPVMSK